VLSDRQAVELFHLHFVRLLCSGPDKDRFAIKGGCNLRFFFESVRYSEDIDLDVERMPVHTLKEKVGKILEGPALRLPLKSRGISVREVSAPKQTETTQRWKVGLVAEGRSLPLHTKIEFSRRKTTEEAKVEPLAASVLAEYQLMPFLAPHYPLDAALRQKVGALIGRSSVQARDVFDLVVLLSNAGGKVEALRAIRSQIPRAIERAMDVSYGDFKSQLASYLKPEHLDEYGTREAWDAMQAQVIEQFEKVLA
jgi:predicted nucleotidyltransferase component of viral defense system